VPLALALLPVTQEINFKPNKLRRLTPLCRHRRVANPEEWVQHHEARFGRDALLTMLTIWWATGSITSSMRDYYDNRWQGAPLTRELPWYAVVNMVAWLGIFVAGAAWRMSKDTARV